VGQPADIGDSQRREPYDHRVRLGQPMITRLAVIVAPALLVSFVWATTPLTEVNDGYDADGRFYGAMADRAAADPSLLRQAPWCWRVLTPFLASLLPFSTIRNFELLAFISNWVSLLLMYGILRRMEYSIALSAVGTLLYAGVFWAVKFSFYSPAYVDFQTQALLLAILFCMLRDRRWLIPVLLSVAVLQKESLLLLSLVVYVHYASTHGWMKKRSIAYLSALVIPPTLALAIIRTVIVPINEYSAINGFVLNVRVLFVWFWPRLVLAVFSGLGVLPVISVLRARDSFRFLRKNPAWAAQVGLGALLLLAGWDKSRLFLYMLPGVVVMVVDDISRMRSTVWLFAVLVAHYYMGHYLTPIRSSADYVARMLPEYAPAPSYGPAVIGVGIGIASAIQVWLRGRHAEEEGRAVRRRLTAPP
jgi:hypothetical protein